MQTNIRIEPVTEHTIDGITSYKSTSYIPSTLTWPKNCLKEEEFKHAPNSLHA